MAKIRAGGNQLSRGGLRVYVLTPSFPPTDGGQEKHLLELSESLIAAGARVQVFSRRVDPSFAPSERMGSVPVVRFGPFGEIKGVGLAAAPRLVSLLCKMTWRLIRDRRRYDIVLVSGFNFMPMCAVVARALTGKPCVVRPESPLEISEPLGGAETVWRPHRPHGALLRRSSAAAAAPRLGPARRPIRRHLGGDPRQAGGGRGRSRSHRRGAERHRHGALRHGGSRRPGRRCAARWDCRPERFS